MESMSNNKTYDVMENKYFISVLFSISVLYIALSCSKTETPVFDNASDLTTGAAWSNCFIVSEEGDYKFETKYVDGSEIEGIATADWAWSSKGKSSGSLISGVSYSDGVIRFSAKGDEGNALIVALDGTGSIVWSWHIWMTDTPAHQQLDNGTVFMDRNLGATSANKSDGHLTFGLKYQWGRKDPFFGGATNEAVGDAVFARAAEETLVNNDLNLSWNTELCDAQVGTMEYAIMHPMTFIYTTDDMYIDNNEDVRKDWMYVRNDYLWSDEKTDSKTNYDPCPAGYRTPRDDAWSFDNGDGGKTHTTKSGEIFWWPLCGTRWGDKDAGRLGYIYEEPTDDRVGGGQGIYWKQTTKLCGFNAGCFYLLNGTYVDAGHGMYRAHGAAVRCEYSK